MFIVVPYLSHGARYKALNVWKTGVKKINTIVGNQNYEVP